MHGKILLDRVDMFGGASAGALVATVLAIKTYDPDIVQVNIKLYCCVTVCPFHLCSVYKIVTNAVILQLQNSHPIVFWGNFDQI